MELKNQKQKNKKIKMEVCLFRWRSQQLHGLNGRRPMERHTKPQHRVLIRTPNF